MIEMAATIAMQSPQAPMPSAAKQACEKQLAFATATSVG